MARPRHSRPKPLSKSYTSAPVTHETPKAFDSAQMGGFALFRTVLGPQPELEAMRNGVREVLPCVELEDTMRIAIVRQRAFKRSFIRSEPQDMDPKRIRHAVRRKYQDANVPDEPLTLATEGRVEFRRAREGTVLFLPAKARHPETLQVIREKELATNALCDCMGIGPDSSSRPSPPQTRLLIGTISMTNLLEQFSETSGPTLPQLLSNIPAPTTLDLGKRQFDITMPAAT